MIIDNVREKNGKAQSWLGDQVSHGCHTDIFNGRMCGILDFHKNEKRENRTAIIAVFFSSPSFFTQGHRQQEQTISQQDTTQHHLASQTNFFFRYPQGPYIMKVDAFVTGSRRGGRGLVSITSRSGRLRRAISQSLSPEITRRRQQGIHSLLFNECDDAPSSSYSLGLKPTPGVLIPAQQQDVMHQRFGNLLLEARMNPFQAISSPHFMSAPLCLASALAPPLATAKGGMSFLQFLFVFTAGGLFFSTAIAAVTAAYAIGLENVSKIWELVRFILKNVWITFTLGLRATKQVLLELEQDVREGLEDLVDGDDANKKVLANATSKAPPRKKWKWRAAWAELKKQLGETKRTAQQGVKALRQEANLYTAALGPPGLVPIQYIVDRLMPLSLSSILEENIRKSLSEFPKQRTIKKMTLSSFTAGSRAPVFQAARVYDVSNAMAFDYTVKWDSELDASVQIYTVGGLARLPVSLKNMKFEGTVRVILCPLMKQAPGYGAILVSFTKPPKINLDIRVLGGELTKLPFLKREITSAMQKSIADSLLWPRRTVIPTMSEGTKRPLLNPKQLAELELSDPLLQAEQALAEDPMLRSMHDTTTPMKGRGRMLQLSEDTNSTDTPEPLEVLLSQHEDVEKGIVWSKVKELFHKYSGAEPAPQDKGSTSSSAPALSSVSS